MEIEKFKLGRWQMLSERLPVATTIELAKAAGEDFDDVFYPYAVKLLNIIRKLDQMIERYVDDIRQLGQLKKIPIYVSKVTCRRRSCMTCLGKYPTHYPYFRVRRNEGIVVTRQEGLYRWIPQKKYTEKAVRQRDLPDFLRSLGMEEERIQRFVLMVDLRHTYIQFYHAQLITNYWAGISQIRLV